VLLQQAKAIPARRNALRKNSKKLPRRRDTRSYHTVVKINKCPHNLGPVEIWDSQLSLFVIQALDGSLCID